MTDTDAVMWGPSIVGYGLHHYRYDTGPRGRLDGRRFSPRKASSLYGCRPPAPRRSSLGSARSSRRRMPLDRPARHVDRHVLEALVDRAWGARAATTWVTRVGRVCEPALTARRVAACPPPVRPPHASRVPPSRAADVGASAESRRLPQRPDACRLGVAGAVLPDPSDPKVESMTYSVAVSGASGYAGGEILRSSPIIPTSRCAPSPRTRTPASRSSRCSRTCAATRTSR